MNPPPYTVKAQGHLADVLSGWETVQYPEHIPRFTQKNGLGHMKVDIFKVLHYPFASEAAVGAKAKFYTAYHSNMLTNITPSTEEAFKMSHVDTPRCISTHVWLRDDPNHPVRQAIQTRADGLKNESGLTGLWIRIHEAQQEACKMAKTNVAAGEEQPANTMEFKLPTVIDETVCSFFNRGSDALPLENLEQIPTGVQLEYFDQSTQEYRLLSTSCQADLHNFKMNVAYCMRHWKVLALRTAPTASTTLRSDQGLPESSASRSNGSVGLPMSARVADSVVVLGEKVSNALASSQSSLVNAITSMTATNAALMAALEKESTAHTAAVTQAASSITAAVKDLSSGRTTHAEPSGIEKHLFERVGSATSAEASCVSHSSGTNTIHDNIVCDGCDTLIEGLRYACLGCSDFDFCARCNARSAEKHLEKHGPNHLFVQLPKPMDTATLLAIMSTFKVRPRPRGHLAYSCDECNEDIHGHRFSSKAASDYDLCTKCYREQQVFDEVDGYTAFSVDAGVAFPLDGAHLASAFRSKRDGPLGSATCDPKAYLMQAKRSERESSVAQRLSEVHKAALELPGALAFSDSASLATVAIPGSPEERTNSKVTIELLSKRAPLLPAIPFEQKRALAARIARSSDESICKITTVLPDVIALEHSQSILDLDMLTVRQYETIVAILDEALTASMPNTAVVHAKSAEATSSDVQASPTIESSDDDRLALAAEFVADVTVADGATVAPGSLFDKIWRVRNSGTEEWPSDVSVTILGGERLGQRTGLSIAVAEGAAVKPGETVDVVVPRLRAPDAPGCYQTFYRLEARDGSGSQDALRFGQQLWIDIRVVGEARAMENSAGSGTLTGLGGSSFFATPHAPSASSRTSSHHCAATSMSRTDTVTSDSARPSALSSPRSERSDPFEVAAVSESGGSTNDGYEIVYETTEGRPSPDP